MTDECPRGDGPTIYDVARAAGVAPSTVSRALSRPGRVSATTAARIRAVARELGYRTEVITGAPVPDKTRILGLLVSDLANPFYTKIIRGAERAADREGYTILVADARESGALEREALERVIPASEGILIGSSRMPDSSLRMIAKQRPTVVLNREMTDMPSVVRDNRQGVRLALAHLATLGHEDLTYLAGPETSWADGVRWRCLRDGAPSWAVSIQRIGPFAPTFEAGRAAAADFLRSPTSAVLAYNDLMALGLIVGLSDAGLRVPDDVSVVGFDDIPAARLVTPSLTTVATPLDSMGEIGVRNLLALVRGAQHRNPRALVLPVRLMTRRSTGKRRARWAPPPPRMRVLHPGASAQPSALRLVPVVPAEQSVRLSGSPAASGIAVDRRR